MGIDVILFRMIVSLLIAIVIGYEREMSRSNAGIKTHALVCLAATLITITQVRLSLDSINFSLANPELLSLVRVDPARLTAQIITGIGFLGAGTIIVTTRNISGLTTAASIWSVAGLGIAVGYGYYDIALIATIVIVSLLFISKHLIHINRSEKVIIKFIQSEEANRFVSKTFERLHINARMEKYDVVPFGDSLICTNTYILKSYKDDYFNKLVDELSERKDIISIQTSNI